MSEFIDRISELTVKYLKGELTRKEKEELHQVINENESNKALFEKLTNKEWLFEKIKHLSDPGTDEAWRKFITAETFAAKRRDTD